MDGDFDILIIKLKGYEEELKQLTKEYNYNDSCLKLELLGMKMYVVFYNYIIDCFSLLDDVYKEKCYDAARKLLTGLSYGLTGLAIFKAPDILLPSLLGSFYLSLKNRQYEKFKISLDDEKTDTLLDLVDSFENVYANKIDTIYEQIDIYEDENYLNNLKEPEKSKRIVCKKLMNFLRKEDLTLSFDDETFAKYLTEILNDYYNTSDETFYENLQKISENYDQLDNTLIKLDKKSEKLTRLYNIIG